MTSVGKEMWGVKTQLYNKDEEGQGEVISTFFLDTFDEGSLF